MKLSVPTYGDEEINEIVDSLKSGYVTMGEKCAQFEQDFSNYIGVKHSIFVNSGSTANLLMLSALSNPLIGKLERGDEIIVPAVTWGTTLWPVIQMGCVPVLVDCDLDTLCINVDKIEDSVTEKTRAIFPAHILGNSCNMRRIQEIADKYDLIVIEDACESLGTVYDSKRVGSFGLMGSFSFYFSHHITTMEGGMVVTNDDDLAEMLRCQRAHGWTRHLKDRSIEKDYPKIDPRFMFCNIGYSVRPTELQGAMGIHQLRKLDDFNACRQKVARMMTERLYEFPIRMTRAEHDTEHTWFAFPVLSEDELGGYLDQRGIETRPIVAGNLAKHPVMRLFEHKTGDLQNADEVMQNGIYWGCHPLVTEGDVDNLHKILGDFYA